MPSDKLKAAYQRYYAKQGALRALGLIAAYPISGRRMMEIDTWWPEVHWSTEQKGLAFIKDDVDGRGQLVRFVGIVTPESYGSSNCFHRDHRHNKYWTGWYTDPDGYHSDEDGYGLCWGVVVQLTARDRIPRFAAGYRFGGCDGGPTIDFSRIFDDERDRHGNSEGATDCYGAREAARYADDLAKAAAEEEREYREEQREDEDEDEDETYAA